MRTKILACMMVAAVAVLALMQGPADQAGAQSVPQGIVKYHEKASGTAVDSILTHIGDCAVYAAGEVHIVLMGSGSQVGSAYTDSSSKIEIAGGEWYRFSGLQNCKGIYIIGTPETKVMYR